jgi:hypothetical protein
MVNDSGGEHRKLLESLVNKPELDHLEKLLGAFNLFEAIGQRDRSAETGA